MVFGICVSAVSFSFFDVSWWPRDEGVFAHIAERVALGEVYGVDVYDFHGGYHALLNAWLFEHFGFDLLVLRYPLVVLTIVQAALVAWILRSVSLRIAVMGGLASVVFGFLMFPNPSPNWYALFAAVSVISVLHTAQPTTGRSFLLGVIVGVCALFRHPSAIFLSFGILLYHLYEARDVRTTSAQWLVQSGLIALFLLVLWYVTLVFEPLAFLWYALPLLLVIVLFLVQYRFDVARVVRACVGMALGGITAFVPMVAYQLRFGEVQQWFVQSFLQGIDITRRPFFADVSYTHVFLTYVQDALAKGSLVFASVQIAFWFVLFLVPLVTASLFVYRLARQSATIHPAAFIAIGFGMVSFYYQISFYFFASFLLFVIALSLLLPQRKTVQDVWFSILTVLTVFGFVSLLHGYVALTEPVRYQIAPFERATLRLEPDEYVLHQQLVADIQQHTSAEEAIFVMPFDAELYFLSNRTNPFPHLGTSFTLIDEGSFRTFVSRFADVQPRLVVYNTNNVYTTSWTTEFRHWLEEHDYQLIADRSGYQVFLLTGTEN